MYSSSDFNELQSAGFCNTYAYVAKAMSFYDSDPTICCEKFRQALESSVKETSSILDIPSSNRTLFEQIDDLDIHIPSIFHSDKLIEEMHILRTIGNKYVHNSFEDSTPESDRLTCYCAMKNIAEWMVRFSTEYPEYIKIKKRTEEDSTKELHESQRPEYIKTIKKRAEEGKTSKEHTFVKIVAGLGMIAIGVVGVILGKEKS